MASQKRAKGLYSQWVFSGTATEKHLKQNTQKETSVPERSNLGKFAALPPIDKTKKENKQSTDDQKWNGSKKEESDCEMSNLSEESTGSSETDDSETDDSENETEDDFEENPFGLLEAFEGENSEDDEFAKVEVENCLLFELRRRTMKLYQCEGHACNICVEDLEYVERMYSRNRQKTTEVLLDFGLLELFQQIWAKYFRGYVAKLQAELEKPSITKPRENKAFENKLRILLCSCSLVVNMTDFSERACKQIIEMELHVDLISYLRSDRLEWLLAKKNSHATEQVRMLLHLLHNVVEIVPEARELYRQRGIVDVLKKFRTCKDEEISCLSLMFLAWVVNEDENYAIDSGEEVFKYLCEELQSSLIDTPHRSDGGFKAVEILEAIKKLAAHDSNKERVIQSGGLPIFAEFLQPNVVEDEQFLAAQIIWTLAFKCAGDIKKENSCVKCLESLLENEEVHDSVKRQARGALIQLGILLVNSQDNARSSPTGHGPINEGKSSNRRIFISYQHGSKETVFRIRDHLRDHGFLVWIDADEISGSLDEDITEGIDNSSVVLVCLSQKYYESPYCRKEVTYADEANKNIIPITVESKYKPQSWLKFRMRDNLRIDFSQSETFAESLKTLLQKINKCLDVTTADELVYKTKQDEREVEVGKQVSEVKSGHESHKVNTTTSGVASWTAQDVQKWLEEGQLKDLENFFDGYDGRMLLCYKAVLLSRTSECFKADFISKFSVKEFVRLNIALQNL